MAKKKSRWYVYGHYKLLDNSLFYVGIGASPNFGRAFTKSCRSGIWNRVIVKYGHYVGILGFCLTQLQAKKLERQLIKYYGRIHHGGLLINMTDGGDGTEGYVITEEHRQKLKDVHKSRPASWQQKITANLVKHNKLRVGIPRPDVAQWNRINKTGKRYKQKNPRKPKSL